MPSKYLLTTLGCKVNQYESQAIRELLESLGLSPSQPGDIPDYVVVNTCAVTASATSKSRQAVRKWTGNGQTCVVAVGCGATAEPDRLRKIPGISAVFGHDSDVQEELRKLVIARESSRFNLSSQQLHDVSIPKVASDGSVDNEWMIANSTPGKKYPVLTVPHRNAPVRQWSIAPSLPIVNSPEFLLGRIERFAGHRRAFVKIQDGCDAYCTYCIIPQLRSQLRSKPIEVIMEEVRGLCRAGYKEIILTGIFLGAFGHDTAIRKRFSNALLPLARLIDELAGVEGLVRLRLSSLEPGDLTDDLLTVIGGSPVCVPHFHLPLQSGSQKILRRMNRQYTRDDFVRMIELIRAKLDRPAITTDIIVGFPGENEEDFEQTLELARFSQFSKIHIFPFSPREKTAAARWQADFVSDSIVQQRVTRLTEIERETSFQYKRKFVGHCERVIVEVESPLDSVCNTPHNCLYSGHADRYFEVHFEGTGLKAGDIVSVRVDRVTQSRCHGTVLED